MKICAPCNVLKSLQILANFLAGKLLIYNNFKRLTLFMGLHCGIFISHTTKTTTKEPHMFILYDILGKLKNEFAHSRKGDERGIWFVYTIIAIIIPFTSSKTRTSSGALKLFSDLPGYARNDSIHSWLRPRFPGIGCESFMENDSLSRNRWQTVAGS